MRPDRTIPDTAAASRLAEDLMGQGYCILRDAVDPALVRRLDADLDPIFAKTPFCEGGFYGERTKRFGRLLARSQAADAFVRHPLILAVAQDILGRWCDTIQLNLAQALELHPGALPQLPHRDQDMWRGSIGEVEYLINVMWPFTDYAAENGATLIWPESHGHHALEPGGDTGAQPIVAAMTPGSALVFLGSTLHGAGGNRSREVRRGMIVSYCLGWLKPYENQWLAYPPEVARTFPPGLAALAGYRQHRPNLGNFEGCCPSILLSETPPEHPGAIDALRPDQADMVADYVAAQRRSL